MTAQRANTKIQMCDQTQGPSSGQIQTAPQVRASTNTAYPSAYAKPWRSEASSTSRRDSAALVGASEESAIGLGMAESYQIEIPMSHDAARLYTANTNSPFLKKFQRRARNTFCAAIRESSRAIRIDSRTAVRASPLPPIKSARLSSLNPDKGGIMSASPAIKHARAVRQHGANRNR